MNMMQTVAIDSPHVIELGGEVAAWIEDTVARSTNGIRLQQQLDLIGTDAVLTRFLHRFVLFNDALAARVPYLAGVIHLTPDVFVDFDADEEFGRQCNGRIAAYVALAASDEYHISKERNMAHQYLSQHFFRSALAHYNMSGEAFDRNNPLPPRLGAIIREVREKFFGRSGPDEIFSALGFHTGLEFFANEEFNLVDRYLREHHPRLVADLERPDQRGKPYEWLAIHTFVEVGHYQAGLEAIKAAVKHYRSPGQASTMAEKIKEGFTAFIDLQKRYYSAILCDVN
jgi:hypothetical protein